MYVFQYNNLIFEIYMSLSILNYMCTIIYALKFTINIELKFSRERKKIQIIEDNVIKTTLYT